MTCPLGIIIPVYNEAENIELTLTTISQQVSTPHIIYIVYDFEEDNTLPKARRLLNKGHPIKFVKNPKCGVANAIKTGLKEADNQCLLVTMADLSDDYTIVDSMVSLMEQGHDLVCGSRYMPGGKQIGGPLLKKTLSKIASLSLRFLAKLPTHDITNSFKMYRKSMVDSLELKSDGGFEIGMEIVIKAHIAGFHITEVPCTWTERKGGESKFKLIKWIPKYLKWYCLALKRRSIRHSKKHLAE